MLNRFGTAPLAILMLTVLSSHWSMARTVELDNLTFLPPTNNTNTIQLTLSTDAVGSDSDTTVISGTATGLLDFNLQGTTLTPHGLTYTGGQIALSDINFSFLFGLLQVQTMGIQGVPSTISPPGPVINGEFDAADHQVTFDQGVITAPGTTVDLSVTPLTGPGVGTGQVNIVPIGSPVGNDYTYEVTLSLPVAFNESFFIPGVPLVGDVNATLSGSGTAVSRQQFTISILAGDYNDDSLLDCGDLTQLEQAVAAGSTDLTFDANIDGVVNSADVTYWLNDLRHAIPGDANLNDVVDGIDFIVWNANKFSSVNSWCDGDFNRDQIADGLDFIVWNEYKFTSADSTAIPEPTGLVVLLGGMVCVFRPRR